LGDLSVLVNSCDKYSDIWPVFFTLFWRYWPDCPYPVYLGTNTIEYSDTRVNVIFVGEDTSWAETTQKMLEKISSPYILWFLDDFFIFEKVDTSLVCSLFEEMKELNGNHLRFRPTTPPDFQVPDHPRIGGISPGSPYRCSLGIGLWKREILASLLKPGETAWEMEIMGSQRSNSLPGFFTTRQTIINRTNGLERGKWLRYNLPLLKKENISVPPGHPIMTFFEHFIRWITYRILGPAKLTVKKLLGKSLTEIIKKYFM